MSRFVIKVTHERSIYVTIEADGWDEARDYVFNGDGGKFYESVKKELADSNDSPAVDDVYIAQGVVEDDCKL